MCCLIFLSNSFIPVWSTSRRMGGVPPSHNTVILLCAVSFLLNHDADLRIFSLRTSGPMTLQVRRWGCPRTSDAAASPAPCAAPGGAAASTPARPPAPHKKTDLMHKCICACLCMFSCIQDQNTDKYIQICTECRSAYLHVCRIKIQTDTYRYAQNARVHICMYSGSKCRQIHTDMHRM
jgi:hypothetical protein